MATNTDLIMNEYAKLYATSWFKMDEGSGAVLNDSKGSVVGNVSGATWLSDGGLSFDGVNDYAVFNDKVIPVGEKTVIFDFYTTVNNPSDFKFILSNGFYTNGINGFYITQMPTGTLQVAYSRGASNIYSTSIPFNRNTWNKVMICSDGSKLKVFLNDMETPVASYDVTIAELPPTYNLHMGVMASLGSTTYFNGRIKNLIVSNKDFSKLKLTKNLILDEGEYKKFNTSWTTVSATTPTLEQFLSDGMDSLTPLLDRVSDVSPIDSLSNEFEVVTWTDKTDAVETLELTVEQVPQLVFPKTDISLLGVETVNSITLTSIGNSKIAVSFDSGLSWKAYKNGVWETVTDASEGMTTNEINALTTAQIQEGRDGSVFVRFSYYLGDENVEIDKIELRVDMLGVEKIANTSDYEVEYDEVTNTIVYDFKKSGTFSVNYVSAKEN